MNYESKVQQTLLIAFIVILVLAVLFLIGGIVQVTLTRPIIVVPPSAQPPVVRPIASQPFASQPVVSQPIVSQPVVSQPSVVAPPVRPVAPPPVVFQPPPVVSQPSPSVTGNVGNVTGNVMGNASNNASNTANNGDANNAVEMVQQVPENGNVVVLLIAKWCGFCKQNFPEVVKAAQKFQNKVRFVAIDINQNEQVVERFRCNKVPSMYMLKNGAVTKYAEPLQQDKIVAAVSSHYKVSENTPVADADSAWATPDVYF